MTDTHPMNLLPGQSMMEEADHQPMERRLRAGERYRALRLPARAWIVIRLDGRGFSRLTAGRFHKPFDDDFRDLMVSAARAVFDDFRGLYACTHSDEISLAFDPHWNLFGRRLEKLVSVSAGLASAAFTQASGRPAHFDSRVWLSEDRRQVIDYFKWRQLDAYRCALHGWNYWTLRQRGLGAQEAARRLHGQGGRALWRRLREAGIDFGRLPAWQRRGVGLYRERYAKTGYDPRKQDMVSAERRRLRIDHELPAGRAYAEFLRKRLLACPEDEGRDCHAAG